MRPWREYRDPRPGEVLSWLSRHARRVTTESNANGTLEARFAPSPCCGHDKRPAALCNQATGLWGCKACGKVGNWFTLTRAFGDPLPEGDRYKYGDSKISWAAYGPLRAAVRRPITGGHYPELLKYCLWRGLSVATLDAWRVSTRGPKTLRWPIYGWQEGRWAMANARMRVVIDRAEAKTPDWFECKGGPTTLCMGNHLLGIPNWPREEAPPPEGTPLPKRVIVTEGQWDAMTAWELGIPNVLSLPHGASHMKVGDMLRYIPEDWEVWLAFDMDEAGQHAVERAFAQLGTDRVARIEMPYKDLNEWLMHDQGLTAKDVLDAAVGITRAMQTRQGLAPAEAAGGGEEDAVLCPQDKRGPRLICETPWRGLTEMLSGGFKAGATTGLLAPSGRGKTTVANQIAVHAANLGVKVGLIMLEDTRENVGRILWEQAYGWTGKSDTDIKTMLSNVQLASKLQGNKVTWRECGQWFEKAVGKGAQLLVLDNLDYIMPRTGGDPNREKIEAYGTLIELAKQSGTHMLVVWQPNKVDPKKIVTSVDQKGMAQTLQDADNYINLNWFENLRRLEVEKHRENGVKPNNCHVWLNYDEATRCMVEVPAAELEMVRREWENKEI